MSTLIIIPTVAGNEENLKETLDSLFINTRQKEYDLVIVKNDFSGFANAVNRALKNYDAEHLDGVCILNDDIILYPFWLEQLKAKAEEGFGIVGDIHSAKIEIDHVVFYMVYIKKEVLQKIGILDEKFIKGNWEDVDFCVRAIEAGFKLGRVEDICCFHKESQTVMKLGITSEQNKAYFKEKWKSTKWENRWD
jgi:GT2 family glycosyltransferase